MTLPLLYLWSISLEFGIGVVIGIFLKNEDEELSIIEIKFATLLLLVVSFFYFLTSPIIAITSIIRLSALWLALIVGVLMGEIIRIKFLKRVVLILKKKDIQLAIAELEAHAAQVAIHNDPYYKELMEEKLASINSFINQIRHDTKLKRSWSRQLQDIQVLCRKYADLSIAIGQTDPNDAERTSLMKALGATGSDLARIAYHTLNHAERDLRAIDLFLPRRLRRAAV
jgi:hypothetical protein